MCTPGFSWCALPYVQPIWTAHGPLASACVCRSDGMQPWHRPSLAVQHSSNIRFSGPHVHAGTKSILWSMCELPASCHILAHALASHYHQAITRSLACGSDQPLWSNRARTCTSHVWHVAVGSSLSANGRPLQARSVPRLRIVLDSGGSLVSTEPIRPQWLSTVDAQQCFQLA